MWGKIKDEAMNKFHPGALDTFCQVPKTVPVYRRKVHPETEELGAMFEKSSIQALKLSVASKCSNRKRRPVLQRPVLEARPSQRHTKFINNVLRSTFFSEKNARYVSGIVIKL